MMEDTFVIGPKDFESLVASLGFDVVERSLEEGPRVTWLTLVMRVAPEG